VGGQGVVAGDFLPGMLAPEILVVDDDGETAGDDGALVLNADLAFGEGLEPAR